MGMVSSISFIFDTGANQTCSSNKGDFVKLKEKILPRKFKGTAKVLEIYVFGVFEYSVRSESGHMIVIWDQA